MNHGCNLSVSPFNIFQARFKEFGDMGLRSTLKVYKVFTKVSWGPWLKRRLWLGPAGVITCTPLSTLFFWVSLFPGAFSYNKKSCNSIEKPHLNQEEPGHIVGYESGCILQYFLALLDLNVVSVCCYNCFHVGLTLLLLYAIYLICMLMKYFYLILFFRVLVKKSLLRYSINVVWYPLGTANLSYIGDDIKVIPHSNFLKLNYDLFRLK